MNIVFLDAYSVADTSLEKIEQLGSLTLYDQTEPEMVVERCVDAQVVITNKVKLLKNEIDSLPALRLICVAATGMNNVDTQYAAQKGIAVRNVPAYSTQSVAEATLSMVLALLRQTLFYDTFVKDGSYARSGLCFNLDRPITQIEGKRWGIIAMGNIGRRVAAIAQGFGAEVSYYSTSGKNTAAPYACVSLDELLKTSDIISIHAPLNDATAKLIGERELAKMKPTAILVNVGRGGIVDERALAAALDGGVIGGAGLDVFENEPIEPNNPLLHIADKYRVVLAPHCGWSSAEAREVLVATIAKNIADYNENFK